ncbi:guanylate kinase [Bacteroidales bacterium]|nr:guanylate kinase [Bacteroidales bacterium]
MEQVKNTMNKSEGKIIIFAAPSGSGKSIMIKHLLENKLNLDFSVSATSREARGQEKDGIDYHFLSPEAFKKKISDGEFLESEEVYKDQFYGTLKSEVDNILSKGKNLVLDVDVVGACNIKKIYAEKALSIFIKAPSIDELRKRLELRGTESPEKIEKRINKASSELTYAPLFDVIIHNDKLEVAQNEALQTVTKFLEL